MATRVVYCVSTDGNLSSAADTVYLTARSMASPTADTSSTTYTIGQQFNNVSVQYTCFEAFFGFDTTGFSGVSSATISMGGSASTRTWNIYQFDWGATLTTADAVAGASLSGLTKVADHSGTYNSGFYNDFADIALVANLNLSGVTRLLITSDDMDAGTIPLGFETGTPDSSRGTKPPTLTIVDTATQSSQTLNGGATSFTPTVTGVHDIDLWAAAGKPATAAGAKSGGGGGAYSFGQFDVPSLSNITVQVGNTNTTNGTSGSDTWFNSSSAPDPLAKGGTGANATTTNPGGAAASGRGVVLHSGGAGTAAQGGGGSRGGSSGGASAAPSADGNNGNAGAGAAGGASQSAPPLGGASGKGGAGAGGAGDPGVVPGGGAGGGGSSSGANGNGAAGKMVVYWYVYPAVTSVPYRRDQSSTLAAWQPPDPNPFMGNDQALQRRVLPPTLIGVRVDNPPFASFGRSVDGAEIIALNQPPDPSPFIGGLGPLMAREYATTFPVVVVSFPTPDADAEVNMMLIRRAWEPPDPLPTYPRKLSPGIPGQSVDLPPPQNETMAIAAELIALNQREPNPLVMRAPFGIPPEPVAVSYVPMTEPWIVSILASWQPADPVATIARKLSPGIPGQSVDAPPPDLDNDIVEMIVSVSAWQPPDPAPTLPRRLAPGIPGQSVDSPVPDLDMADLIARTIVQSWQPPDPLPTPQRKLAPGVPGQSVDMPPPNPDTDIALGEIIGLWQPPDPAATIPRKLSPGIPGQSIDAPPGRAQAPVPWTLPDGTLPQLPEKLVPIAAAAAGNPPMTEPWMVGVLVAWAPPDPAIVGRRNLPITVTAVPADNPPFAADAAMLASILKTWEDVQPAQLVREFVPQPFVAVSFVPYARAWLSAAVGAWADPLVPPTQARKLAPGIPGQSVDNPPPDLDNDVVELMVATQAWQPPDVSPILPRKLAPGIPGQSIDNPPPDLDNDIVEAMSAVLSWQPGDPAPTPQRKLSPGIPGQSVDNPPPDLDNDIAELMAATQAWQPADGPPVQRRKLAPGIPGFSVDVPPPRVAVQVAWPALDVPQQPGFERNAAIAFSGSVPAPEPWLVNVLISWQPADAAAIAARLLNPQLTAVRVDNPPFTHQGRAVATASIIATTQPPDPNPFIGGLGPLSPRGYVAALPLVPVNDPPFKHWGRMAVAAEITALWQPPDPNAFVGGRQPLDPRKLPPSITDVPVNNPPFSSRTALPSILRSWETPFILPQELPAGQPQVVVVSFLPFEPAWMSTVLQAWVDVAPAPQKRPGLAPGIPGQSVDQPPPRELPPSYDVPAPPMPIFDRSMAPGIPGQSVDPPPPQREQPAAYAEPPAAMPVFDRAMAPGIPGVSVDNPPRLTRGGPATEWYDRPTQPLLVRYFARITVAAAPFEQPWLASVIQQWQPDFLTPQRPRRLPPQITAVRVDSPPFDRRRRQQQAVVDLWQPGPPFPIMIQARFVVPIHVRIIGRPQILAQDSQASLLGRDAPPQIRAEKATPSLDGDNAAPEVEGELFDPTLKGKVD